MRKLIVLEHISLDGVIQAPGGPEEDTSGGFAYGGWISTFSDEVLGKALREKMNWSEGMLHGNLNQCVARTGRLSSTKPNLQNISGDMKGVFGTRFL